MIVKISLFISLFIGFLFGQSDSTGIVKGRVLDADNQLPLIGANVMIKSTTIGTVSDEEGYFSINEVPMGDYTVTISYMGYKTQNKADIWIRPNGYDFLNIKLESSIIQIDDITVEESYFERSMVKEYQVVSFNRDELRRYPGTGQEITRVINTLPSVASVGENRQDMMVRGGGPTENGFIIDNIPIPSVSHFQQADGRSNGPVGLINTDMVENLDFFSNGFSSKYGNKLSSFGDITYRSGNREKVEGYGLLGMGGLGYLVEGPISDRSTYIASYRMSYLDIIADAINASGGMPSYDDFQAKLEFRPNIYNTFSLLIVNGGSLYDRDRDGAIEVGETEYGRLKNDQMTIGINYKHIWSKRAYSNTSISNSIKNSDAHFLNINSDSTVFKIIENTDVSSLRQVNHFKLGPESKMEFGFEAQINDTDYNYYRKLTKSSIFISEIQFDRTVTTTNYSSFITFKQNLFSRLILSAGMRLDKNDYEKINLWSPRINLDYELARGKTNLIFNSGVYHQNPPGIYIANETSNKLKSVRAYQHSLSLEHMISSSTKLSISAYQKKYNNSPILPDATLHNDPTFLFDELRMYNGIVSNGTAVSDGLEILIQKKKAENFYGLVGGSIFNSTFSDYDGIKRNRNHNYRYIFNIVGGYRPNTDWELSIRWSYFGGRPYTPINLDASILADEQILYQNEFNEDKTPDYHSLFIHYEKRYNLKRANLILFFEIWNTYNRKNIENYFYSRVNKNIGEIVYFSTIPVAGLGIEF
jgi:hypothetical protein